MEANKFYRSILTGAILLVLFRLYAFGMLALVLGPEVKGFARYCVILPIAVAILICACKARKIVARKEHSLLMFIVFTVLAGVANIILLKEYYPELELNFIIRDMSIFHLFLIFPLLLLILPFKEDDYRCILDRVVIIVINIGGPLIIFEALGYALGWFTYKDTHNFIGAEIYGLRDLGSSKPLGILADSPASGILFAASTVYCLIRKVSLQNSHFANNRNLTNFRWATIIIGMGAVLSSASLTSILIMGFLMFCGIYKYGNPRFKLSYITIFGILLIVGIIYFPLFNIVGYFMNYVREKDRYIPMFLPTLTWDDIHLWGYYTESSDSNIGEFHFFWPMFRYGFVFFIPWILLVFFPLAKVFRFLPTRAQDRAPLLLCMVFLLGIVHYCELERWGNNYIYALAAFMLFKSDRQKNTAITTT